MLGNIVPPKLEQVNIHELMEKVTSKRDVYNFLTQECEAYLPKMDTINIFFLKQITRGAKDVSIFRRSPASTLSDQRLRWLQCPRLMASQSRTF